MNWRVAYRGEDGKLSVDVFEAENRESLFKALADKGISAVRIERTAEKSRTGGIGDGGWRKRLVAGTVVVALVLGTLCFLASGTGEVGRAVVEKPRRKAARTAAVSPKRVAPGASETVRPARPLRFWEVDAAHTNGFTEMQMRKWRKEHMPPPGYTNNAVLTRPKPRYAIFKHPCENLIAAYLTLKPGEGMVGTPVVGERFRRQFLKSLEEPITVTEEDSPEDARLKRDMIATKADLKARMDAGEDVCKILSDTHREVQDLARYKSMLQKEVHEAAKNPDMTMQDVDDLLKAANMMLDAKGVAPITLGPISRRLIQRRKGF